ncbi:MAG TPA: AAA family ATPase [Pirellulales bacterium]|nr:AAA family ATPase [Pirellulales bacterium]
MLTRLRLINYRSHSDTTLDLRPLNLFIGPVAAGKSNLFKALLLIQNSVHRSLVELFPPGLGEFHWVRSRWAQQTDPIGFEIDIERLPGFPDERARYSLQIADSPAGLYVLEESLVRDTVEAPPQWIFRRMSRGQFMGEYGDVDPYEPTLLHRVWQKDARIKSDAPGVKFAKEVARALSRFGYYHLEASQLKSLGTGQSWDRIDYNGKRLPDFIAWAKFNEANLHVYESLRAELEEVLPELDAIIVTQASADQQGLAISFKGHNGYIAAPDLSDGTLFTLGLLCLVHQPKRPALLCVEEPETGLHPKRLRWLFDRFAMLTHPDNGSPTQVCLSTHSPYLVDLFREIPEAIQLVEQSNGRSRVQTLNKIQTALHVATGPGEAIGHEWATGLFEGL